MAEQQEATCRILELLDEDSEIAIIKLDYESTEIIPQDLEDVDWDDTCFDGFEKMISFNEELTTSILQQQEAQQQEKKNSQTPEKDQQDSGRKKEIVYLFCSKCNKRYQKRGCLEKHEKICNPLTGKQPKKKKAQTNESSTSTKGKLTVTLDKVMEHGVFKTALTAISTDKINCIDLGNFETFGNRVRDMALDLLSKSDTDGYKAISKTILTKIYGLMSKRKLTQENDKQNLLRELNVYQSKKETHKIFDAICPKTTSEEFKSFLNLLMLNIMTEILRMENYKEKDEAAELKLTTEEQQVLRYSAGYIIFAMRRRYFKLLKSNVELTRSTADGAMKFIETIIEEYDPGLSGETYLEFTQKWVELRNRGGLVQLSDNFYLFIRRVEGLVKGILTVEFLRRYRSEDLRDVLMERIRKSDGVNIRWDILTKDFEGGKSLKDMLKIQIISKWIDIRARSFVKGFIELMKQVARKEKSSKKNNEESERTKGTTKNQTVSNKAEVGFRKKLK